MTLAGLLLLSLAAAGNTDEFGEIARDASGQRIWKLSSFLKGTPAELRVQVNRELQRLTSHRDEVVAQRDRQRQALSEMRASILQKSPLPAEYRSNLVQLLKLTTDLAAARKKGDSRAAMDLSSQCNSLREKISKMESDVLRKNDAYAKAEDDLKSREAEASQAEKAVQQSREWRDKLVATLAATLHMPTPLIVGRQGLLGKVQVVRILDSTSAQVQFRAEFLVDDGKPTKASDGMVAMNIAVVPTPFVIAGLDTSSLKAGSDIVINKTFKIDSINQDGGKTIDHATKSPPGNDIDTLMDAVSDASPGPTSVPSTQPIVGGK